MSTGLNPLIQQGQLNRILTAVQVNDYPLLAISASFMSKALSTLTFDDDTNDQIGTATGVVNSQKPYQMATLQANILRSQALVSLYYAQLSVNAVVGTVKVFTDSTTLGPFTISNASIMHVDPGPFDGQDPTTKVTFKGIYYVNNVLWTGA